MKEQLIASKLFSDVILRDMPDPFGAKESEWVPFLLKECGVDSNTLIIGHSSGAEAAMRLMENCAVLVLQAASATVVLRDSCPGLRFGLGVSHRSRHRQ
jgi:predicted alpha/beta hydrolase family esterase